MKVTKEEAEMLRLFNDLPADLRSLMLRAVLVLARFPASGSEFDALPPGSVEALEAFCERWEATA